MAGSVAKLDTVDVAVYVPTHGSPTIAEIALVCVDARRVEHPRRASLPPRVTQLLDASLQVHPRLVHNLHLDPAVEKLRGSL